MDKVRIIIADDDPNLRGLLRKLLSASPDIEIVGIASDGDEAVELCEREAPDVALMDIGMPRMTGIEATRRIRRALPTQVVIWTIYGDDQNVFEAIKAGALGYLLKDSAGEQLINGVLSAARGESPLHPAIAVRVLDEFQRIASLQKAKYDLMSDLTARETEILKLVATGKRNKEIADQLFLTEKTVKNHITNILFKLQVNSRTEAAIKAIQEGLVKP